MTDPDLETKLDRTLERAFAEVEVPELPPSFARRVVALERERRATAGRRWRFAALVAASFVLGALLALGLSALPADGLDPLALAAGLLALVALAPAPLVAGAAWVRWRPERDTLRG